MTYTTALSFSSKAEAFAHLNLFGYEAMPLRNRYTNRTTGDFGEARIGFAHIETTEDGCRVHEVDMPLKRG
jgi:hypothetical protein